MITMEEELCEEEPLGLQMVAHGDCKQQQTTVGENNNMQQTQSREKQTQPDTVTAQCAREYVVLTGSCVRRKLESSSCCKDTADSARESGSGPRSPRHGSRTPDTSGGLPHTRRTCRSAAKGHLFPCPQLPPPGQTSSRTCGHGLCGETAFSEATVKIWTFQS